MKKFKVFVFLNITLLFVSATFAQDDVYVLDQKLVTVSGKVVNTIGDELPGLVVVASNSKKTEFTDGNGDFTISVQEDDYLIITGLDFNKAQFIIKDGALPTSTLVLKQWSVIDEEQKINVAFGSLDFERVTGSVERITGDELAEYPSIFVEEALAGRLSGVTSFYGNSSPVRESFLSNIRGEGVGEFWVDGVQSPLVLTTPEVDDIVIAKDFGSSFLYGGFSSPGAMIINSKKGLAGDKSVKVRVRSGARLPNFSPNTLNAQEYARIYNRALANDGLSPQYTEADISGYTAGTDSLRYPNHDFRKELLNTFAGYTNLTVDFSGGSKAVQYFSHLGYYTTDGVESVGVGRSRDRLRFNNNLQIELNDLISANIGIGGSFTKVSEPTQSADQVFSNAYQYPANAYPYKINDSIFTLNQNYPQNLLEDLSNASTLEDNDRDAFARLDLDFDLATILKGLSFRTLLSLYSRSSLQTRFTFTPNKAILDFDEEGNFRNYVEGDAVSSASNGGTSVVRNQSVLAGFNYTRNFGESHKLNADLIYYYKDVSGSFLFQDGLFKNIGARVNYMLEDKYVIEANYLNVGVRQLFDTQRKNINYSTGLGWLLHKEAFMKNAAWLNFLKLRGNYGVQTNINSIDDVFNFAENEYGRGGAGIFGIFSNTAITSSSGGFRRTRTGAFELSAPQKEYLSVGADFSLFNKKVNGQINYFNIRDYDQWDRGGNRFAIFPTAYLPLINLGDTERTGYDGSLSFTETFGNLRVTLGANAFQSKEIVNQDNSVVFPEEEAYRNSVGRATDVFVGLESDGLYENQAAVDAALPSAFGEFKPGDIRYKDFNGDGVIDEKDLHVIGNANRFFYGLNLRMKYKNFSFSVHGDGAAGGSYVDNLFFNRLNNNYAEGIQNSWFVGQDNSNASLPRLSSVANTNNYLTSTFWLKSASFFNLRSVSFAYQLPRIFIKKMNLENMSFFLSGKNLTVFSSNENRYAPSINSGYSRHPVLATVELGLEVSF